MEEQCYGQGSSRARRMRLGSLRVGGEARSKERERSQFLDRDTLRTKRTDCTIHCMSQILEYSKITDARAAIADIYSTASRHLVVEISREGDAPVSVIRKDDLKSVLRSHCALDPQVRFSKDGQVSMWIEDVPVSSQGPSFEDASNGLIEALRDYAQTWIEDLKDYPNHKDRWALATLIRLSDNSELHQYLFGDE